MFESSDRRVFAICLICLPALYLLSQTDSFWPKKSAESKAIRLRQSQFKNQKHVAFIITTWRSGSSFLGALLSSGPSTFYFYEPFGNHPYGPNASVEEHFLRQLQDCNFEGVDNKLWSYNEQKCTHLQCTQTEGENYCRLHQRQVMKIIKLKARIMQNFFASEDSERFSGFLLVRDPRAVWNSRKKIDWCLNDDPWTCGNQKALCDEMTMN